MKIGVLIDELLPGGVQKTALEETRHFIRQGQEAELLALTERNVEGYKYEDLLGDIPVKFLSKLFPVLEHSLRLPGFNTLSTYHVASFLIAPLTRLWRKFDVIIGHGAFASAVAWNIWKLYGTHYVSFVWDTAAYIFQKVYLKSKFSPFIFAFRPIFTAIERSIIGDAAYVLTPSNVHTKMLREDYRVDASRVKVLYPGCYPSKKIPEKRGDYLLSFTRWEISKNPYFLVDLMKQLANARLIIAGEWTDRLGYQSFLRKIKEEAIGNRVTVLPTLKKSDIPRLCSKARVWVHPNFESFGMGALEAASQGCPIIIPKGSGVAELFNHGIHGFFPSEGNVDAYYEYVSNLLSNERLAWRMGYEAWKVASERTWENHTKELEKFLKSL